MTPVRLRFRSGTRLPVDASHLLPATLAGKSAAELGKLRLRVGNREEHLGELAEVAAGDTDALVIEGAFAGLDRVGRHLRAGRIEIHGDVGAYLGQGMSGGRIELSGSAGVHAAAGMRGGIDAACRPGVVAISAGNYGGGLGPYHFHLRQIMAGS